MATCKLTLDRRVKDKAGKHNFVVVVNSGKHKCFLNIAKMTEEEYCDIFLKKSVNTSYSEFKKEANEFLYRAEHIVENMKIFDRVKLRELFYNNSPTQVTSESLSVTDLFENYFVEKPNLAIRTVSKMKQSRNSIVGDNKDLSILEVDKIFLSDFKRNLLKKGRKENYINGIFRDTKTIINYFTKTKNIIPSNYEYPFGAQGIRICNNFVNKEVLKATDIKRFLSFSKFENDNEKYSHHIWELLYLCNGINFADLFRLRWDQKKGDYFIFFRKKTQNTRKNHKREIIIPISERLRDLLDKVSDKNSEFVLGKLISNYGDQYYENKLHKYRGKINKDLRKISERLKLPILLTTSSARDCYATTLKRNGVSIDVISEMLGHSNTSVTQHYLGSMDMESVFKVNEHLIRKGAI